MTETARHCFELRDKPGYPSDPGEGLRIERLPSGEVEVGITYDGKERMLWLLDYEDRTKLVEVLEGDF